MKALYLVAILLASSLISNGQYRIRTIEDDGDRPPGTLGRGEILIVNLINPRCVVECSIDRQSWRRRTINYESTIEVSLDEQYPYFYLRLLNVDGTVAETKYRLRPGNKYKIVRDSITGILSIRSSG